ncbi:hypothetical protein [Ramlibacter sp. WS9]|uniref:hypothetical protein n=1 Tax=Ramlibacter sp. WS9 TaxID=1882741 RepID=UPI00116A3236|nr:hypothetical protein [Ramlibacter sp. WS9]ROZ62256.1 hypothetical protein EEB15_31325 [Ramlibacter sp. WS9]
MNSVASPPRVDAPGVLSPPPVWLRAAVRDVLSETRSYTELSPEDRRGLAQAMVRVGQLAADCVAEEREAQAQIEAAPSKPGHAAQPMAKALADQPGFGESARRIGDITRDTLQAISFPRFVTDLLNGVFRAMNDSSQAQLQQYLQLLNAVSSTASGFEQTQTSEIQVRAWLVDHFPDSFEMDLPEPPEPGDPPPDPEDVEPPRLRLRAGASMPPADGLRAALGVEPNQEFNASNPEALVPLARRQLARQRQQMLATMVQMGMQRIIIDAGKINASMRFHIDTRSAANQDQGNQFSMQNRVRAAGSFGAGPWGVSAEVENTIAFVTTNRQQTTEEINTSADLNSSVELHFHTDAVPLNRLAAQAQADRVRGASLNPDHEAELAAGRATTERLAGARTAEESRRGGVDGAVRSATPPALSTEPLRVPAPGSNPAATPAPTPAPTPTPTPAPTPGPTPAPTVH